MTLEDMQAAQAAMDLFRIEHADLKRRREAEFAALQLAFKAQRQAEKIGAKAAKKVDKEGAKRADKEEAEKLTAQFEAEWRHALQERKT